MSKIFEIIIFTASRQDYADAVIDQLDPSGELIQYRLYRQHCVHLKGKTYSNLGYYTKDIRTLQNRYKEDMIIVDNLVNSFACNVENGIPIKPYIKGKDDVELEYLADTLSGMKNYMDCPLFIDKHFKFNELYAFLI